MPRTLIVTNDFPPRLGGIESFVADVVGLLDHDVVVYTSASPGAEAWDRGAGVEVVRGPAVLLPTPATARRAAAILRRSGATRVVFGAAAPLGLLAGPLRRAGAERLVALSHGHETWWATVPGARALLRRIGDDVDHLSTISDYTAARIAPALSPAARARMIRLAPSVDTSLFAPAASPTRSPPPPTRSPPPPRSPPRPAPGAGPPSPDQRPPRVVAVGRLIRQKGHDTLLHAWRLLLDRWPAALAPPELALVGDGPRRAALVALADRLRLTGVSFEGAVPRSEVVSQLQRADVFALAVRTRWAGLNPEGLGLAAVEAAACGLPVVVGRSGGAPETVRDGRTGFVVDPRSPPELAAVLARLLTDPALARAMGEQGRRFATATFGAAQAGRVLREALELP